LVLQAGRPKALHKRPARRRAAAGSASSALIILSGTLVMFGVGDAGGPLQGIATIPEFLWELSLGIYCTAKGFRPSSPLLQGDARDNRSAAVPAASPA
jgi:hypothetical protein